MDFLTFIDKHATPIIAVIGTLAGVVISQISTWLMKRHEFKNQVNLRRIDFGIEFEKKNLIEPVLLFLESDLELITAIYQQGLDREKTDSQEGLGQHILEMSMVSARLGAYGNEDLIETFDEFTRKRIQIGFDVFDDKEKNMPSAHNKIKEAEALASKIIIHLKKQIESLKT